MRLPKNMLSQSYTKPRIFLCDIDKSRICQLDTTETKASFNFNAYDELTFTISRTYTNMITGATDVNPFYDKIEALRLIEIDGMGFFEIQEPEIVSDGIKEVKNITAYGLEYTLSQKYLEEFYVNTGENNSIEVIYADGPIVPVRLYNPAKPKLSLLHLILEKIYGWSIGHVDPALQTMTRTFEISRESVYDFIVQDVCDSFNCFAIFDTTNNTINLYAESLITKFIGDGKTTTFTISPPYSTVGAVTINSYKTTWNTYDPNTGILTLNKPPEVGAIIEVVDNSQTQWMTDVYVSFENLAREANISYSADDIKTVLTVKGADDLSIREVNMGLPYIVDLSYYYNIEWMGKDLYEAYTAYLQKCNNRQTEYVKNSERMWEINHYIDYEEHRLSLQYSVANNVTSTTVGTYYVKGGTAPNYYYTEVTLPEEYSANVEHYYTLSGTDINETKFASLYEALKVYFNSKTELDTSEIAKLKDDFVFMQTYTIDYLVSNLSSATELEQKSIIIMNFLNELWDQLGRTPLNELYYKPYKEIKDTNEEAGWNDTDNENYWLYYPVVLVINSLSKEIADRDNIINEYNNEYKELSKQNAEFANDTLIYNNFTDAQLVRLSAFMREDEYTDDNFIETDSDSLETIMKTKQELLECGKIELAKLCEPRLEFSMDLANIYAMPEFEPIVNQFQLGNLIKVVLRNDYVKRARLLAVNINFDDFSDFSCEFGELTNLKTPSSIHADLLTSAMQAGRSVASNSSYWTKGSDTAISTDLKLQQGLLDAVTVLKSIDGTQGVSLDKYGIHLRKYDPVTGVLDPHEGWLVNNSFIYSDDNFKTARTALGEFTIDGQTYYGLLADAVFSGYIESSTIRGGTINIGDGAFIVNSDGTVVMGATNNIIEGYAKEEYVDTNMQTMQNYVDEAVVNIQIYSVNGDTFKDGVSEIELRTTSYCGITPITGDSYKWYYYSNSNSAWVEISDTINLIVSQEADYAYSTIKCVMTYNGNEYEDFFALTDAHNQYTATIKFFNGTRIFGESEKFLVAYVALYKNGVEIDPLATTGYYYSDNTIIDEEGLITTDIVMDNITGGELVYFIYKDNSTNAIVPKYLVVLGRYDEINNKWMLVNESRQFTYTNSLYSDIDSKIIVIAREDVTDNIELTFSAYPSGDYSQLIVQAYDTITNVNGLMKETMDTINNVKQYMKFDPDSGLRIAQNSEKFYVNIDATEMGFYDNTDASNPNNKIVSIGTNSATIKNMVVISDNKNPAEFNCNANFNQSVNIQGFVFQIESNGSFSLAISK